MNAVAAGSLGIERRARAPVEMVHEYEGRLFGQVELSRRIGPSITGMFDESPFLQCF